MKTLFYTLASLVLLASAAGGFCAANLSANNAKVMTLDEAITTADSFHPRIAEARELVVAAGGRVDQSGAWPNPEAVARIESAPMRGNINDAEFLGGISQSIPVGGRIRKARETSKLERARAERELDVVRAEVHRGVHSAFATALYQEQAFQLQSQAAVDLEKAAAIIRAQVNAGDASGEDAARMEIEVARAKMELNRAGSKRKQALSALAVAIGTSESAIGSVTGRLFATFSIPAIQELTTELSKHPSMALADAEVRVNSGRIALAKAERIPDVQVELLYRRIEPERRDAFDVGISVPLPLFDRKRGRVVEAQSELRAAEARSRAVENELGHRLREAHGELTLALEESRLLNEAILPKADMILNSAERRFESGDISLRELLLTRREWSAVQMTYLESLRSVMLAWSELSPFVGR